MDKKYAVRIVIMDDDFSNSISSCDCAEKSSLNKAISLYNKICKRPQIWIDTNYYKNFYVCVESFINVGYAGVDEWEYQDLIKQQNFRF